jgi:hypothetical protein
MVVILMFYGLIINLYQFDRVRYHILHIHTEYQGKWGVFPILGRKIIEGKLRNDRTSMRNSVLNCAEENCLPDRESEKAGFRFLRLNR